MRLLWFKRGMAGLLTGLVCILLVACATPQRITEGVSSHAFDRTGRFALSVDHSNGKQDAVQGGFAWHDTQQQLRLDLANPLGNTLARVQVLPGYATMVRSDGSKEQAQDPDALVELVLGSPIPVTGLREWLHGQIGSAPVQDLEKDSNGQISSFNQNGWRVRLSRYDELGPRLLQLNRSDPSRNISVRLAVDAN